MLDHGFLHDRHALFDKGLLGESGDFGIFDRKDAIEHLDHSRLGPQRVVETGEFNPDRARANDQQLVWHTRRLQRVPVGPDQITIRLKSRQLPRPRAGGQNDVPGAQVLGALVGLDPDLALGGQRRLAHDHRDLVLLHQMADAGIELLGHVARAFDHRVEIESDACGRQTEFLGTVHQVKHFRGAQQRFGRDTAPVKTDAPHVLAFDDGNFEAQLGAPDCSNIATGSRADHDHVISIRRHWPLRIEI